MIHKDVSSRAEQKQRDLEVAIKGRWGNENTDNAKQSQVKSACFTHIALLLVGLLFIGLVIIDICWPLNK